MAMATTGERIYKKNGPILSSIESFSKLSGSSPEKAQPLATRTRTNPETTAWIIRGLSVEHCGDYMSLGTAHLHKCKNSESL
jgi:hypothetical protein